MHCENKIDIYSINDFVDKIPAFTHKFPRAQIYYRFLYTVFCIPFFVHRFLYTVLCTPFFVSTVQAQAEQSTLEGLDMQMVRQAMLYGTIEDYI